jgi:hypothetical protein
VFPPRLTAPGVLVLGWKDQYAPTINGKTPTSLDDYEMARSYAIAPDGRSVVLGTEWAIRRFDVEAKEIWSRNLPAVAWSVNVSGNGEMAVAALSDGTVRWYRMRDGKEVINYFPHGNGRDWMAVDAGRLLHFIGVLATTTSAGILNRGKDQAPDFYRAVQFDRILYRPDVVADTFRQALGDAAGCGRLHRRTMQHSGSRNCGRLHRRDCASCRPRFRASPTAGPARTLRLEGEKTELGIRDYAIFVNGIPVTPSKERALSGNEAARFSRTGRESICRPRTNEIRVEAFNGVSMGVAETYIGLPADVRPVPVRGDLYVLAIGVNSFPNLPEN